MKAELKIQRIFNNNGLELLRKIAIIVSLFFFQLKINPKSGEVVARIDFSEIVKKHNTGTDDVLNGISFKGQNMLVTGKNWDKI